MRRAGLGEDIRTSQSLRILVGKGEPLDLAVCLDILRYVLASGLYHLLGDHFLSGFRQCLGDHSGGYGLSDVRVYAGDK